MRDNKLLFERLYADVSGSEVSHQDRANIEEDRFGLVYGEITFDGFSEMLACVKPKSDEIFYDLGSGAGKAVFCSALLYDWKKCCGIELLSGLHNLSITQLEKFNHYSEVINEPASPIEFIHSNILDYDFRDANVVFINATCFMEDFWKGVVKKLDLLQPGTRIMMLTKQINHPKKYKLLEAKSYPMSWGMNSVNTYLKIK